MSHLTAYDWAYGRHSGIPDCCIEFYVDRWDYQDRRPESYASKIGRSEFNYVPCPSCFAERRQVHLLDCAAECGQDCAKAFYRQYVSRVKLLTV